MSKVRFTRIHSRQVKGKGRGKLLGYPTINLEIKDGPSLAYGIYASWVGIGTRRFMGALHWGPVPTFRESDPSLEVFLLDAGEDDLPAGVLTNVAILPVERLRDVLDFPSKDALTVQIGKDIEETRRILGE